MERAPVFREVGKRAEHPAAEIADRAALVQRPVVSQGVPALERLVADRAAQSGRGDTCRAQQQRVRIAAQHQSLEPPDHANEAGHARQPTGMSSRDWPSIICQPA